ncbi:MAG TPA: hypothetical protein VFX33_05040 [Actinomycetales bacterium]|nr:hypothetical protein [Actinomycetales bacterium]
MLSPGEDLLHERADGEWSFVETGRLTRPVLEPGYRVRVLPGVPLPRRSGERGVAHRGYAERDLTGLERRQA